MTKIGITPAQPTVTGQPGNRATVTIDQVSEAFAQSTVFQSSDRSECYRLHGWFGIVFPNGMAPAQLLVKEIDQLP